MVDMEAKRKKDRTKEIVAYSILGFLWLGGLTLCILGVYAIDGPGKLANNPIYQAQKNFSTWLHVSRMVDFRILGAVICLIVMGIFLAYVNYFANKYEKDEIRKAAQIERLHDLIAQDKKKQAELAEANKANVIDVDKEPEGGAAPAPANDPSSSGPKPQ